MPPRPRVPDRLLNEPFTARTAAAHDVTPRMLRGKQWVRLMPGVRAHRSLTVDHAVRVKAARLVLPDDAFATHLLAAWLHGAWRPAAGQLVPLHWATRRGRARPGTFVSGSHRVVTWPSDVVRVDDVPCTSPMSTAFLLMREAPLVEAVVVADAFAARELIDLPCFAEYVHEHRQWPSVRLARTAAKLAAPRAASPGESRLRMIPVLGGLPAPSLNRPIFQDGALLGYVDLYLVGRRPVGLEYDGAYHEQTDQRHADNRRENRLTVNGNLPLLRYDRFTVARHGERNRALLEIAEAIGVEPARPLRREWFDDPRRPFHW